MFSGIKTFITSHLFQLYSYYFSYTVQSSEENSIINEEIKNSLIKIQIHERMLNSKNSIIIDSIGPLYILVLQRQKDYLKGLYKIQGKELRQDEERAYSVQLDNRCTIKSAVKCLNRALDEALAEQEDLEKKAAFITNTALLQLKRKNLEDYISQLHYQAEFLMRQSTPYWPQT